MTAIPCGQKKSTSEMIQSQTVTPPLAAIDGTTLRLKTATTKRRTRSKRPRTRRRCGASAADEGAFALEEMATSFDKGFTPRDGKRNQKRIAVILSARASWGAAMLRPYMTVRTLVAGGADFGCATLSL